jgi:hypothetical protein
MKKNYFLFIIILFVSVTFSCSKNENCTFNTSTFLGKWKISKVVQNGVDTTNAYFIAQPCQKTYIMEFKSSGILSEINSVSSCSVEKDKNWFLRTIANKNYLIMNDIGKIEYDTIEISSVGCTSIEFNVDDKGVFTLSKQ